MLTIDYIALAVLLVCILIGATAGFGKVLKFITKGITGKIISVVVCYFIFGVVYSWEFVQNLLNKIMAYIPPESNFFFRILHSIRLEVVVLAIILFVIVQLLRVLVVNLIDKIVEIDTPVMKVINKTLGVALTISAVLMLTSIIFSFSAIFGQGTDGTIYKAIEGSFIGIDNLYKNNPVTKAIVDMINNINIEIPTANISKILCL